MIQRNWFVSKGDKVSATMYGDLLTQYNTLIAEVIELRAGVLELKARLEKAEARPVSVVVEEFQKQEELLKRVLFNASCIRYAAYEAQLGVDRFLQIDRLLDDISKHLES